MGTQSGKMVCRRQVVLLMLLVVVARGANVMQLDGKQAEIDGASVKQQLKFEDEMELSQLEEERDHLMLLVEEMETASNAASTKAASNAASDEAKSSTKDQAALALKDKLDALASAKKALDKMPSGPEKDEMVKEAKKVAAKVKEDDKKEDDKKEVKKVTAKVKEDAKKEVKKVTAKVKR